MSGAGFDRLRRRAPDAGPTDLSVPVVGPTDPQGRRSLYSVAEQAPALGAVAVHCSHCNRRSVVTPRRLLTLALPSVHLPVVKRDHPSWMRCPACGRRTWVRLGLRV
ncbi:MAG TPA: hypothetical protein VF314_07760 [Actinomycetes bacterium]